MSATSNTMYLRGCMTTVPSFHLQKPEHPLEEEQSTADMCAQHITTTTASNSMYQQQVACAHRARPRSTHNTTKCPTKHQWTKPNWWQPGSPMPLKNCVEHKTSSMDDMMKH